MSGFRHDIAGGAGALEIISLHSPNYVAGVSGWAIFKNGNVEFNSGTFRGTVTAGTFQGTDFIINSNGEFYYSGVPALGNLIASNAATSGTDAFGNNYVGPGFASYDGTGAWAKLSAASLLFQSSDFAQLTPQGLTYQIMGAGAGRQIAIRLKSPAYNAGLDSTLFMESASADGGITSGATIIGSLGQGGSFQLGIDNTGNPEFILGANTPLRATQPGGTNAETWHAVTLPGGMTGTIRVKALAEGKFAALDVNVSITSSLAAANTYVGGALPSAAYYPVSSRQFPLSVNGQYTANSNASPRVVIPVSLNTISMPMPAFAVAGVAVIVSGLIVYPLD